LCPGPFLGSIFNLIYSLAQTMTFPESGSIIHHPGGFLWERKVLGAQNRVAIKPAALSRNLLPRLTG
jgi:hypothetical protein